jgi:hypothetical protein
MVDVLKEAVRPRLDVTPTVIFWPDERTVSLSSVVTCPVESFEGFLGVRQEYVEEVVGFVVFRRPPRKSRWSRGGQSGWDSSGSSSRAESVERVI